MSVTKKVFFNFQKWKHETKGNKKYSKNTTNEIIETFTREKNLSKVL